MYFNRETNGGGAVRQSSSYQNFQTPDMEDVKESVRQGVTKVAGRLSGMASGVMNSIQVSRVIICPCSHIILLESQTIKLAKVMVTILTFVQPSSNQSQLII